MKSFLTALAILLSTITPEANAQAAANELLLLTSANTVTLRGPVTDSSVLDTQLKLFKLVAIRGAKQYPLYLVLDSPGGSIDAGLGFIEFAKTIRNLKTISIFAASMASGIAQALPGERLITQNGITMFHRAAGRFQGYFETGEVESHLELSKSIMRVMEATNATRLKMTIPAYKEAVHNELWIYSGNNITQSAADKVVDLECSNALVALKEQVTFQTMFGSGSVTFSGCPLMRSPTGGDTAKYLVSSMSNYRRLKQIFLGLQ